MPRDDDVTGLLVAWGQGDRAADSRLIEVLYQDLRRVARRRLSAERADHSLAPTALVHEAYMRLIDLRRVRWQNRAHFFAIAARVMRQILVDHARAHGAVKRGGARWTVPLTAQAGTTTPREVHLLDLDAALDKLAAIDGRLADLVMLRFFGGLTVEEAAEVLELSPATVKRDWARARAWLFRELRPVARSTGSRPMAAGSRTSPMNPADPRSPCGASSAHRGASCSRPMAAINRFGARTAASSSSSIPKASFALSRRVGLTRLTPSSRCRSCFRFHRSGSDRNGRAAGGDPNVRTHISCCVTGSPFSNTRNLPSSERSSNHTVRSCARTGTTCPPRSSRAKMPRCVEKKTPPTDDCSSTARSRRAAMIWALPLAGKPEPFPVLAEAADERYGTLSTDGRWLAYISNETATYQVYVAAFPTTGFRRQVSTVGGFEPLWRRDGKELFYMAPDQTLMSVEVDTKSATPSFSPPRALFSTRVTWMEIQAGARHYGVARDGRRFLISRATDEAQSAPVTVGSTGPRV